MSLLWLCCLQGGISARIIFAVGQYQPHLLTLAWKHFQDQQCLEDILSAASRRFNNMNSSHHPLSLSTVMNHGHLSKHHLSAKHTPPTQTGLLRCVCVIMKVGWGWGWLTPPAWWHHSQVSMEWRSSSSSSSGSVLSLSSSWPLLHWFLLHFPSWNAGALFHTRQCHVSPPTHPLCKHSDALLAFYNAL